MPGLGITFPTRIVIARGQQPEQDAAPAATIAQTLPALTQDMEGGPIGSLSGADTLPALTQSVAAVLELPVASAVQTLPLLTQVGVYEVGACEGDITQQLPLLEQKVSIDLPRGRMDWFETTSNYRVRHRRRRHGEAFVPGKGWTVP